MSLCHTDTPIFETTKSYVNYVNIMWSLFLKEGEWYMAI